jgi:hypothetical protein
VLITSQHDEAVGPLPTWARPPGGDPPHSTRRGVVIRAATASVVAGAMVAIGHRTAAAILVTVFTAVSVVSWRVPAVARAIERFLKRFQHLVGRFLTVVVLTAVYVMVFVPAALVLRLLRRDPLALGSRPDDASFWRPAARSRRPLHRRTYTYERHPVAVRARAPQRRPLRTALAVLGTLVLIAGVDLGAGMAMGPEPQAEDDQPGFQPGAGLLAAPAVGARAGEAWAEVLHAELGAAYEGSVYHPFRGWTVPDFRGVHVNVEDEVRRSYQTSLPGPAVEVFFFGGSTMMGWFQRDEHTIPSEIVRLAEADGIAVEAFNYGQPAYQNWQEVMLLQELVSSGAVPDLAVFYDGANELGAQFRSGPSEDPIHLQSRAIEARLADATAALAGTEEPPATERLVDAYLEISAVGRAYRASPVKQVVERVTGTGPMEHPWPDQKERPRDRGRAAASLHGRGVALGETLSSGYDFQTRWFWQPFLYTKDAVPGEEDVVGSWGTDPASWGAAYDEARGRLAEPVVDLSDALDGVEQPIFYDFVHTNEWGARAMAEAMYQHLKPTLLALQGGAAP